MGWDWREEMDFVKFQIIRMLFDGELELSHCEVINGKDTKEIALKFTKKV